MKRIVVFVCLLLIQCSMLLGMRQYLVDIGVAEAILKEFESEGMTAQGWERLNVLRLSDDQLRQFVQQSTVREAPLAVLQDFENKFGKQAVEGEGKVKKEREEKEKVAQAEARERAEAARRAEAAEKARKDVLAVQEAANLAEAKRIADEDQARLEAEQERVRRAARVAAASDEAKRIEDARKKAADDRRTLEEQRRKEREKQEKLDRDREQKELEKVLEVSRAQYAIDEQTRKEKEAKALAAMEKEQAEREKTLEDERKRQAAMSAAERAAEARREIDFDFLDIGKVSAEAKRVGEQREKERKERAARRDEPRLVSAADLKDESVVASEQKAAQWACTECTFLNDTKNAVCVMCEQGTLRKALEKGGSRAEEEKKLADEMAKRQQEQERAVLQRIKEGRKRADAAEKIRKQTEERIRAEQEKAFAAAARLDEERARIAAEALQEERRALLARQEEEKRQAEAKAKEQRDQQLAELKRLAEDRKKAVAEEQARKLQEQKLAEAKQQREAREKAATEAREKREAESAKVRAGHQIKVVGDFSGLSKKISDALEKLSHDSHDRVDFVQLVTEAVYDVGLDPADHYLVGKTGGSGCGAAGLYNTDKTAIFVEPDNLYTEYFEVKHPEWGEAPKPWGYGVCRFMLHHEAAHVYQYHIKTHANVFDVLEGKRELKQAAQYAHITEDQAAKVQIMYFERTADAMAANTCKCWQCCRDWADYLGMMSTMMYGGRVGDPTSAFSQGCNSRDFLRLFGNSTTIEAAEKYVVAHRAGVSIKNLVERFEKESEQNVSGRGATHPQNAERAISTFIASVTLKSDKPDALCAYHKRRLTREQKAAEKTEEKKA